MSYDPFEIDELEAPKAPPRFQPIPWEQFANLEVGSWIIKEILPAAELVVIYGEPGSGKTFMALDAAMSIARGLDWHHKRVTQGRVVYICAEGAGGFKKRLKAYEVHHKLTTQPIAFDVIADAPDFLHTTDTEPLIAAIGKASVIIVDTFSRTLAGGNENAGEDVGMAIAQCKLISQATGALVILIHHSGKDATRGARGWSGLKGAVDTEIEVIRIGDRRKGRISKQKDGDDEFEWGFKLDVVELGHDEDGDMITSCVYVPLDEVPIAAKKDKILGKIEQMVYDAFNLLGVYSVDTEEIIESVKKSIAYDKNKPDRRRDRIIQAINSLKSRKLIDLIDGFVCKP